MGEGGGKKKTTPTEISKIMFGQISGHRSLAKKIHHHIGLNPMLYQWGIRVSGKKYLSFTQSCQSVEEISV